ncbi:transposase domain-containing protein [Streptomyces sp. NPDC056161]|uniref:transposase domain-containing protein n=1 Tax=Streptomyces sp. NPDC056161 TaxID=3345732 RepID=UPI0035D7C159
MVGNRDSGPQTKPVDRHHLPSSATHRRCLPRSLVDEVLAETGRGQQRNRLLPSRLVVYFVLVMCLSSGQSHEWVVRSHIGHFGVA